MSGDETQLDRIESNVNESKADVRQIKEWINGNGNTGAKVRLDRLEQSETGRRRWARGTLLAAITAVFAAIFRGF